MEMVEKIRIGALISGGGTNLQAIIDACEDGSYRWRNGIVVASDQSGVKGTGAGPQPQHTQLRCGIRAVHSILPAGSDTL